jgi:hypothetical protein
MEAWEAQEEPVAGAAQEATAGAVAMAAMVLLVAVPWEEGVLQASGETDFREELVVTAGQVEREAMAVPLQSRFRSIVLEPSHLIPVVLKA